jgi:hypothetical protein
MTTGFPFREGSFFSSTAAKQDSFHGIDDKDKKDYCKRAATIKGDMARPDKMTATRQILLNRGSLLIICASQSDVSI